MSDTNATAGAMARRAKREALTRLLDAEREKAREAERQRIVRELEKLRESLEPEWSSKRAIWNFALLIARGRTSDEVISHNTPTEE